MASRGDKWLAGLEGLSATFGVVLVEAEERAILVDGQGRAVGQDLIYIAGYYIAPRRKKIPASPVPVSRDLQGFVHGLNRLCKASGVSLRLGGSKMLLVDRETMIPLGRLANMDGLYACVALDQQQ